MVENLSSDTVKLVKNSDENYSIDFGGRVRGQEIMATVKVGGSIKKTEVTCGCTTPEVNGNIVKISYNSNRLGNINQRVTLHMLSGEKIKINVLGTVS